MAIIHAKDVRVEEGALGDVEVPADHLWGAQTKQSLRHFAIGVERYRWGRAVVRALGVLKKCAALANAELGQLPAATSRCLLASSSVNH